ncbi:MAG: 16S rRNA (uracil(1498)-N(3))-methyltransferase [Flavobacterium sp. BFFFF1]|uniref:16S rRNA (uracil(1498)-N(3))-methyltransferase n=1 Tax=Flavobacterium sp. BFFFF1 TaxID=2015557 RepID=UPI000BC443DB|nr:16S rRNA (uracil(1498)-N(3))-methyltransferase [Flavobacterium sp. BFFFF1]OYU80081.1 MAG: 16S rRNA (uracil(1498)-N(3))-methyltransferase [Flavobacterium sp. BFFFF1]
MQLFYHPDIDETTSSFAFDKEESRHIIKVLRKQGSDILFVTNGLGLLFKTEIALPSENKCLVNVVSIEKFDRPKPSLHLAVAPTKMNERFEWFLEKATEIGIAEITPIICDHSERKVLKTERMDKILLSAMKQSNQFFLPILHEAIPFRDFAGKVDSGQKFIAHCEETGKRTLKSLLIPNSDCVIMIGPEGDFSEKEIKLALENDFIPVTLGETRLRTETAAVVAAHSVVFFNEQ